MMHEENIFSFWQNYVVVDNILSELKSGVEEATNSEQMSAFESLESFRVRNINGKLKCSSEANQTLHVLLLLTFCRLQKNGKFEGK